MTTREFSFSSPGVSRLPRMLPDAGRISVGLGPCMQGSMYVRLLVWVEVHVCPRSFRSMHLRDQRHCNLG